MWILLIEIQKSLYQENLYRTNLMKFKFTWNFNILLIKSKLIFPAASIQK